MPSRSIAILAQIRPSAGILIPALEGKRLFGLLLDFIRALFGLFSRFVDALLRAFFDLFGRLLGGSANGLSGVFSVLAGLLHVLFGAVLRARRSEIERR